MAVPRGVRGAPAAVRTARAPRRRPDSQPEILYQREHRHRVSMRGDFRHRHDGYYLLPAVLRERHDDEIGIGRLLHRAARRRQWRRRYDVGQAHRQARRETGARDGLHRRGDRLGFHGVCGLHLAKPPHRVRHHDHHRPRPRLHHGHTAQLHDAREHRREGIELGAGRAVPRPLHRHRNRARHHGRVRRARERLPAGQPHGCDAE